MCRGGDSERYSGLVCVCVFASLFSKGGMKSMESDKVGTILPSHCKLVSSSSYLANRIYCSFHVLLSLGNVNNLF